jgi:1-phosphofructokinase
VKPNIHELEAYFHEKFETHQRVEEATQRLLGMGIEIVIVSMGADGAIVANHQHAYKVDSWDIPIKSTVGAGDSMVGALAYSILKQDSLYEIARITTAAGTITASKSGTQICELDEVQQALVHVTVKQMR